MELHLRFLSFLFLSQSELDKEIRIREIESLLQKIDSTKFILSAAKLQEGGEAHDTVHEGETNAFSLCSRYSDWLSIISMFFVAVYETSIR